MSHAQAPNTEQELSRRAAKIAGMTLGSLARQLGLTTPVNQRRFKGWTGELLEMALGADAGSRPEPDFTRIGVELKTLPLNTHGQPKESTYVCNVPLTDRVGDWMSSAVRRKLQRVLWVPVESDAAIPLRLRRLGNPFLWSPDEEESCLLRHDWDELTDMIALGRLDEITARYGRCLQIRPKAANARSLMQTFDGEGQPAATLPRGFYLRASFTAAILRRYMADTPGRG